MFVFYMAPPSLSNTKKQFASVLSAQPHLLDGALVTVEVDVGVQKGPTYITIVGLADRATDEARDRVQTALKNALGVYPQGRIVVSLAPAHLKKEGSYCDLAIAVGILRATEMITCSVDDSVFIGELTLDGNVRSVRGVLALVESVHKAGIRKVYVPCDNAKEAALIEGVAVYPVGSLSEIVAHLAGEEVITPQTETPLEIDTEHTFDFVDIRSQEHAKRGLLIAAAGGHNVALIGPPGTGKTLLARALASILPPLSRVQALEVARIHSISGNHRPLSLVPPVRSPHHSSSHVAIIGGGTYPRPGEVTLAHHGVLFLDEFPEFDKRVIEGLRQPLEDREVHIARAHERASFPASCMLVIAMNPCPCGNRGSQHKVCRCSGADMERYRRKLSGPIVDRIDIWLTVEHVPYEDLESTDSEGTGSEELRIRVENVRGIQYDRSIKIGCAPLASILSPKDTSAIPLDEEVVLLLRQSATKLALSPRAYHRTIRLCRTISDAEGSERITQAHVLEALSYRPKFQY